MGMLNLTLMLPAQVTGARTAASRGEGSICVFAVVLLLACYCAYEHRDRLGLFYPLNPTPEPPRSTYAPIPV